MSAGNFREIIVKGGKITTLGYLKTGHSLDISYNLWCVDRSSWSSSEGIYRWESGNTSAELRIVRSAPDRHWVFGLAFWGIQNFIGSE